MREYGFLLTHILPYKDKICPYTIENGSVKTRILVYLMQCGLIHTYILTFFISSSNDFSKYLYCLIILSNSCVIVLILSISSSVLKIHRSAIAALLSVTMVPPGARMPPVIRMSNNASAYRR